MLYQTWTNAADGIWNLDRSLHTELALKDVYNKKKLHSAIGFEKEKRRGKLLNTVS